MLRLSRAVLAGAFATMIITATVPGPTAFAEPSACPTSPSPGTASATPSLSASPTDDSPDPKGSPSPSPTATDSGTATTNCPDGTGPASPSPDEASGDAPTSSAGDQTPAKPAPPKPGVKKSAQRSPAQTPASPTPDSSASATEAAEPTVTLEVAPKASPVRDRYYADSSIAFTGSVTSTEDDQKVEIWSATARGDFTKLTSTTADESGDWDTSKKSDGDGVRRFYATLGGNPEAADTVHSSEVSITITDPTITLNKPPSAIDSLITPKITGSVSPARAGVLVHFQVKSGTAYHDKDTQKTDSSGRFSFTFTTGKGELHSYWVRARHWNSTTDKWVTSASAPIRRGRVLNATIEQTTAGMVSQTYRAGCPVGPSKLRTVRMNYEGFDGKMHRGVLIVRSGLEHKVTRSFGANMGKPIRRMDNPGLWGGNDPQQMEADNTSAFNCRKVTGNPYAQSPHSYGIAIDVNTRENPYRDVNGKWWPESGKSYIKRTPWREGMLTKSSVLTEQLRSRGYFWGGLWYPGRDYQHFENNN